MYSQPSQSLKHWNSFSGVRFRFSVVGRNRILTPRQRTYNRIRYIYETKPHYRGYGSIFNTEAVILFLDLKRQRNIYYETNISAT